MKAIEIMKDIFGDFPDTLNCTVDRHIYGDENREVKKIAVCHIATPNVIRAAGEWGADLMITHEPTFYDHLDRFEPNTLSQKKRELLDAAGFTVYRYHDTMHFDGADEVSLAFIERLGLRGEFDGQMGFVSTEPVSAVDIARAAKESLGICHARIIGDAGFKSRGIKLALGMRGSDCFREFRQNDEQNIAVCGELCEWYDCEPIRDASQLGIHKAIVELGHADSEKFAMEEMAKRIDARYGAAVRYFDCGEIYSYID